jgi:serine/threonine protein phosphatase PrpC
MMSQSVFDFEFGRKPSVSMSQHIEQMDKHQDQTFLGKGVDDGTGEEFDYGMVTDGHGAYDCIEALRGISNEDMSKIIGKPNPAETLWNMLSSKSGGATLCLTKVYANRIVCINCGDSQVAVYKDGALVYLSKEHNWTNQQERERLVRMNPTISFEPSSNIKVINDTQLIGEYTEYVTWPNGTRLACSQALGDSGKTECCPDHNVIDIEKGSTYKIFIGSDGFWDMINKDDPNEFSKFSTMNAKDAVEFVKSRWLQVWDMKPLGGTEFILNQQFRPTDCDDMCVVAIDIST